MDPFAPLQPYVSDRTYATLHGDLDAEYSMDTTQSCAETGCGGGLGDLLALE